ncbi:MAG TPA: TolC family protein [Bacteroidales bacterium]|nr:TolC family protein [Bacteroidales bacterium]
MEKATNHNHWVIFLLVSSMLSVCPAMLRGVDPPDTPLFFTLQNVIEMALQQSPESKNIKNKLDNAFWNFRNYKTSFRPSLNLSGSLPDFRSKNTPIIQPDGSVLFRNINLSQSSVLLSLNQEIAATGATIYAATDLARIDDFEKRTLDWSSSPFLIGLKQPVFGFNNKLWTKKIEPLRWEESQKNYAEEMEQVAYTATQLFFESLRAQTDVDLSESNLKNSLSNLEIANENRKLGKISQNDFDRINLSVLNAKKALNKASMELEIAEYNLRSYIGSDQPEKTQLVVPEDVPKLVIDMQTALDQASSNRKEYPQLKRRMLEAERNLKQARKNNGLNASLDIVYGLTNTGKKVSNLLTNPEVQKIVQLSFSIPVLDWGRSASSVKMAESKSELVKYEVDQQSLQFEREIIVQVEQFRLLYEQIETSEQADKVAEDGYQIALKQYQNGNLGIINLNIALQEREQARRDFINSLASFWMAYYKIRMLTLYDFENNRSLKTEIKY